jgi:hypothetical protein
MEFGLETSVESCLIQGAFDKPALDLFDARRVGREDPSGFRVRGRCTKRAYVRGDRGSNGARPEPQCDRGPASPVISCGGPNSIDNWLINLEIACTTISRQRRLIGDFE